MANLLVANRKKAPSVVLPGLFCVSCVGRVLSDAVQFVAQLRV